MYIGFREIREMVGILEGRTQGNNGEQGGAVHRQPGTKVDDSCHIWRGQVGRSKGCSKGSVHISIVEQDLICVYVGMTDVMEDTSCMLKTDNRNE
jgi:hypothetical protein